MKDLKNNNNDNIEITSEEIELCKKALSKVLKEIKLKYMLFGDFQIIDKLEANKETETLSTNSLLDSTIYVNIPKIAKILKKENMFPYTEEFIMFILEHEILHYYIGNISHFEYLVQKYGSKYENGLIQKIFNIVSDAYINSALLMYSSYNKNNEFETKIRKLFYTKMNLGSYTRKFFLETIETLLQHLEKIEFEIIGEKINSSELIKIPYNIFFQINKEKISEKLKDLEIYPLSNEIVNSFTQNLYTILGNDTIKFLNSEFIKELKSLDDFKYDRIKDYKYNSIVQEDILFPFKIKNIQSKESIPNIFIVADVSHSMFNIIKQALAISKFLIRNFKSNKKFFIPFSNHPILYDLNKVDFEQILLPPSISTNFLDTLLLIFNVAKSYSLNNLNILVITDGQFNLNLYNKNNMKKTLINIDTTNLKFRLIYFLYTDNFKWVHSDYIPYWYKQYFKNPEKFLKNSYFYHINI